VESPGKNHSFKRRVTRPLFPGRKGEEGPEPYVEAASRPVETLLQEELEAP
jgi:hypothetical protein